MPFYYENEIIDGNTVRTLEPRPYPQDAPAEGALRGGSRAKTGQRLGERLIEKGLITAEQLAQALKIQARETSSLNFLGEILISLGYVPARQVGALLEEISGTPYVNLDTYPIDRAVAGLVPEEIARQRLVLPLRADDEQVWLAMEDPLDLETIDVIQRLTGRRVVPMLALLNELLPLIHRSFAPAPGPRSDAEQSAEAPPAREESASAPTAAAAGIHLETGGGVLRVRYSVNGVAHEQVVAPQAGQVALLVICCDVKPQ